MDGVARQPVLKEESRLQRLRDEDRLVVYEPFSDLPGVWAEIPESSVLIVQPGEDELRPFRRHVQAGDTDEVQALDVSRA